MRGSTGGSEALRDHARVEGEGRRGLGGRRNVQMSIEVEGGGAVGTVIEDPNTPLLPDAICPTSSFPALSSPPPPLHLSSPPPPVPLEPMKTFLAFLWLWSGFVATTASLALTHERVPDIAPLPDALLDNIQYQRWGLDLSEILLVVSSLLGAVVVFSHTHRLIILRRVWLILGVLYYYRAITMFVTVLPKPDETYVCAPKTDTISTYEVIKRVVQLLSGGGLSINGQHVYCGDYIFSGHTMTLTIGYLTIKHYSPRRYTVLHWVSFLISCIGVASLIASRGHYSIDVLLAYFVTTRLWWIYHAMATHQDLKLNNDANIFSGAWWFWIFWYFERQVPLVLPRHYSPPIPRRAARWLWSYVPTSRCCKRAEQPLEPEEGEEKDTGIPGGGG